MKTVVVPADFVGSCGWYAAFGPVGRICSIAPSATVTLSSHLGKPFDNFRAMNAYKQIIFIIAVII